MGCASTHHASTHCASTPRWHTVRYASAVCASASYIIRVAIQEFVRRFCLEILPRKINSQNAYAGGNCEIPTLSRDSAQNRGKTSGQDIRECKLFALRIPILYKIRDFLPIKRQCTRLSRARHNADNMDRDRMTID